jgi:tRNA(Met) C34 N-acetyltransferase TmcA
MEKQQKELEHKRKKQQKELERKSKEIEQKHRNFLEDKSTYITPKKSERMLGE